MFDYFLYDDDTPCGDGASPSTDIDELAKLVEEAIAQAQGGHVTHIHLRWRSGGLIHQADNYIRDGETQEQFGARCAEWARQLLAADPPDPQ